MAQTKNTVNKSSTGLPLARFSVPTGDEEWQKHHALKLKIKLPLQNCILSDTEDSPMPAREWMNLTPSLQGGASPLMEKTVEQGNNYFD